MNDAQLFQLLVINRGLRLPSGPSARPSARAQSCLVMPKPAEMAPVRPVLDRSNRWPGQRRSGSAAVVWMSAVLLACACVIGVFSASLMRVYRVREEYQVSVQLRQREHELHHSQRAYWALQAYVAAQSARDFQQPELSKSSAPPAAPKRASRS